jgi:hypothetical protein
MSLSFHYLPTVGLQAAQLERDDVRGKRLRVYWVTSPALGPQVRF